MLQMLRFEYRAACLLPLTLWQKVFVVWFRPTRQLVPRFGHDRFLPNLFWFIRDQSSYTSTSYILSYGQRRKNKPQNCFTSYHIQATGFLRTQYDHRRSPAACGSYGRRESSHPAVARIHFWCCYYKFAAPIAALFAIRNMVWLGLKDDHERLCRDHGDPRDATPVGWIPSPFGIEHTKHSSGYVNVLTVLELIFICNFMITREKTCRTVENVMWRTIDKKPW